MYLIALKGMEDKTENGIKMIRESVSNFDAFVKSTTQQIKAKALGFDEVRKSSYPVLNGNNPVSKFEATNYL